MAPKQKQRDEALSKLSRHLLETGLSQISLRQLAKAANISDRMLLYYFKNKEEVLAETMRKISMEMILKIEHQIPAGNQYSISEFLDIGITLTGTDEMGAFMRLFIETIAAAARDEKPFPQVNQQIIQGFLLWIEERLSDDIANKRAAAAMILASLDGLAILEIATDKQTRDDAANIMRDL